MASYCASAATLPNNSSREDIQERLNTIFVVEPTLHQVDVLGDGTGFLQAGFLFTNFHHWATWLNIFPLWHGAGAGDIREAILLMGKAAGAVGGDNYGRRYVFEQGKVVIALGYSVSIYEEGLTAAQLSKSVSI